MLASARPRLYYGWVIVVVALVMNIAASPTNAVAFSFFVAPMSDDLGWSRGTLALGLTFRLGVAGVTAPFIGILVDRIGARLLGTAAGAVAGVSLVGLAFVNDLWLYYLLFAISGLSGFGGPAGQLLTTVPVAKWFQAKRGRAMAIATVGMPLGTALYIPLLQAIIDGFDWRLAWVVSGLLVLVLAVPACALLMRKDPESLGLTIDGDASPDDAPGKAHTRSQNLEDGEFGPIDAADAPLKAHGHSGHLKDSASPPDAAGAERELAAPGKAHGEQHSSASQHLEDSESPEDAAATEKRDLAEQAETTLPTPNGSLRRLGSGRQAASIPVISKNKLTASRPHSQYSQDFTLRQAMRSGAFWRLLGSVGLSGLVIQGALVYRTSFWEDIGISSSQIALGTSVDPLMVVFSGLFFGLMAERMKVRYIGWIGLTGVACSMIPLFLAQNSFLVLLSHYFIWGLFMGANITANNVVWPDYFGRRHLGTIRGVMFPVSVGTAAISPPFFALLASLIDPLKFIWLIAFLGFAFSGLLVLSARPPRLPQNLPASATRAGSEAGT